MSFRGKRWIWPETEDNDSINELTDKLDLTPAFARLLHNRGISDFRKARAFLDPTLEQLYNPFKMLGMDAAVKRIVKAIESGEKIIVHGDYDADGITATVILVETLQALGGNPGFFLPSRFDEGYGLHIEPLRHFREAGADLVITVDCGINAVEEAAYAAAIGLDMIITDHHQPLSSLQGPLAIINPLQKKCSYPFKELSGAGIAFKLASALYEKSGKSFPGHLLDLVALGTTADVVPLLNENRILVSSGLAVLRRLDRVGFKALIDAVSLTPERINSKALSFILAPAVNAAGRMGEALPAAELLLETDMSRAIGLAAKLDRANQKRRSTEQDILRDATAAALEQMAAADQMLITLAADNWHHGVIGIVASRLVEKFNRPVALVALDGDEGRGSARSIPGFDITEALACSSDSLLRFGGHEQAAGFTVSREKIDELREKLNRYASANIKKSELIPPLNLEAELQEGDINLDFASSLDRMEPYGTANYLPLFGSRSWELLSWRFVGADKSHLKLKMRKNSRTIEPIFFSAADLAEKLEKGRRLDLAFRLKKGYFRRQETLEVEIKDLNYSDEAGYLGLKIIDKRFCRDRLKYLEAILADNNIRAAVFTATNSRRQHVERKCSPVNSTCYISSGSGSDSQDYPDDINTIILFDLPLSGEIIKPFLNRPANSGQLTIYLLYNEADLQVNRTIINHTLPNAENLAAIINELENNNADKVFDDLSLSAGRAIAYLPAPAFWERSAKILSETQIISADKTLSAGRGEILDAWFDALDRSSTYKASVELRDKCELFQKELLTSSPAELAKYLYKYISG